VLKEAAYSA